jgi:hypothetical protein
VAATSAAVPVTFVAIEVEAADQILASAGLPGSVLVQASWLAVADSVGVVAMAPAELKIAAAAVATSVVVAVPADVARAVVGSQLAADFASQMMVAAGAIDFAQGPEPG